MTKKSDFLVLLVGRPNVGKSTIFNKIMGTGIAHTSKNAGTTIDVNIKATSYMGTDFLIADSGGFNLDPDNEIEKKIKEIVSKYAEKSGLILLVVDYKTGLIPEDMEIYRYFIKSHAKIFLVINKVDSIKDVENSLSEFSRIGGIKKFPLSAENSLWFNELLDAVIEEKKSAGAIFNKQKQKTNEETIKIAIVGKPNSGKSTYINAILKEELIFVDEKPGTTRDSIDTEINYKNKKIVLIDTAGIRKRSKLNFNSEGFQKQTLLAIKRADVVAIFIDISEGITHEDLSLLKLANTEKKQFLIAFTKWDLINDEYKKISLNKEIEYGLKEFGSFPYLFISSIKTKNIYKLIDLCAEIYLSSLVRIKTAEINRFIAECKNDPKAGRLFRYITYGVQKKEHNMPAFIFFADNKGKVFTIKDIKYIRDTIKTYFTIKSNVEVLIEYKKRR